MVRVTSSKIRQALLSLGSPLDPESLPERLQLFDEDGNPVDVSQDPSKMRWAGVWNETVAYIWNDVVMDEDSLFILTNPSGIAAGDAPPSISTSDDWFLLTRPSPPAFMGLWSPADAYLAGAIVSHEGTGWATTADVSGMEPGVPTGANWGTPVKGIQAKSTDKINQDAPKIIEFTGDTPLNDDGIRCIPVVIDFPTSTIADSHLYITNHSDDVITVRFSTPNGSYQTLIAPGNISPGVGPQDFWIRHATFFGYGDSTIFMDGYADTLGEMEFTITCSEHLVPPDAINPWLPL